MKQHSLLSPSSSTRWINCSGSVLLPQYVEDRDTTAADEGTLAHAIAECYLKTDEWYDYKKELKELRESPLYKPEMERYVDTYLNVIGSRNYDVCFIEELIDLNFIHEDLFGTADCVLLNTGSFPSVEVIDFKYGYGKVVPEHNTQLMLYALGAVRLLQKECPEAKDKRIPVTLTIVQPRIDNISSWQTTWEKLKEWSQKTLIPALSKLKFEVTEQNPGDWCRFCNANIFCKAYNDIYIDEETTESVESLSDSEIENLLKKADLIDKYLKRLKSYVKDSIKEGKHFKNYKLVAGRNKRLWRDEEDLKEKLAENHIDAYKLFSPADLEKLVGKKVFKEEYSEFIETKQENPQLVKREDKRKELTFEN